MADKSRKCRFCDALSSIALTESIVEKRTDGLYVGGIRPTEPQIEELAREASLLKQTSLWKLLTETVKAQALDMGIKRATDFDQLMFAKAMLHIVGIQEAVVEVILEEKAKQKK